MSTATVEIILRAQDQASRAINAVAVQLNNLRQAAGGAVVPMTGLGQAMDKSQVWSQAYAAAAGQAADATQDLAAKTPSLTEQLNAMQAEAMAASIAFGAIAAAGVALISKMTMYAARTEELGIVIENMARVTGHSQEEMVKHEEAIKKLGITTQAARTLLMRFMGANMDVADAARVARAAQDLAVIGMQNSSEAAMDLAYSLSSLQPRLLRKYGIYLTLTEVYRDAAHALGKNVQELTAMEKRQAFLNATLEIAARYTGTYESAMTSAAKQIRSFQRFLEELANQFGAFFLPILADAVSVATAFVQALLALPAPIKDFMMALLTAGTVSAGFIATIAALVVILPKLVAAWGFVSAASAAFGIALGPVAIAIGVLVAGLILLKKHLDAQHQATIEAQSMALELSQTYEMYATRMKSAGEVAHILTREIWELAQAEYENAEATGKSAIALAAQAVERQKALDILRQHKELQEIFAETQSYAAEQALRHYEALSDVAIKSALLDQEFMDLLQSMGLVTQEMITAIWAAESLAAGTGVVTRQLQEQDAALDGYTQSLTLASSEINNVAKGFEKAAPVIEAAWANVAKHTQIALQEMKKAAKAFSEDMTGAMTKGVASMRDALDKYLADAKAAWDSYHKAVESALLSHQISVRESEIKHLRQRAEVIAQAQAEIAALEAAGLTDKAEAARTAMDKELDQLDYNYQKQKAWAEWHWEIQQLMQEKAHYERLLEMAEFAKMQVQFQYDLTEAVINSLALEALATTHWAEAEIIAYAQAAGAAIDWAKADITSMKAVQEVRDNLLKGLEISTAKYEARLAELEKKIQERIKAGPDLPPMPDYSQWVDDYSSGLSDAGSKVRESATKTFQEVAVDIAKAFKAAMEIFEEVAKYETPIGLAAGMEMLRVDIEEAVRQMYLAYDAIGKEGVEGARLIAEAANSVAVAIKESLAAFKDLPAYSSVAKEKFYALRENIFDAINVMLSIGAYLWQAGHDYRDVEGVVKSIAKTIHASIGWMIAGMEAMAALKDYTSPALSSMEAVAADIAQMVTVLMDAIGEESEIDQFKLQWTEWASNLISILAGVVDNLNTLATFDPFIYIGWLKILMLVANMKEVVKSALRAIGQISSDFQQDDSVDRLKAAWLDFQAGLVSTLAGVVDDLNTLAGFDPFIYIGWLKILMLVANMKEVVKSALRAVGEVASDFQADDSVDRLKAAWLEFAAGLISTLAGAIDDLQTLADFDGNLKIATTNAQIVILALAQYADAILDVLEQLPTILGEGIFRIDETALIWLEFSTDLISLVAGAIDDMETLSDFEGNIEIATARVQIVMLALAQYADAILDVFEELPSILGEGIFRIDETAAAWLEFSTRLISTLASVIEDVETLSAFEGGLVVAKANIENLVNALKDMAGWILDAIGDVTDQFDDADKYIDKLKIDWAEIQAGLVSLFAGIVSDIETLAEFEGVDYKSFRLSIDNLFDALYAFLDEFNRRAGVFEGVVSEWSAGIAELMGKIVSNLGGAIEPITKISEIVGINQQDFKNSVKNFFDALYVFLEEFNQRADSFEGKVNKEVEDLAAAISKVVGDLGSAVEPLIKILEYTPGVLNVKFKINEFFDHLDKVLEKIEEKKDEWQVSDAALDLANRVQEIMGYLEAAVTSLSTIADYKQGTEYKDPVRQFGFFCADIEKIVGKIEDAKKKITDEALDDALEFVTNCATVVANIKDGIEALNSLQDLQTGETNLVEAGKNLIASLIDGLIAACNAKLSEAKGALSAFISKLANHITGLAALVRSQSWGLGASIILGMVDGLENQSSYLYWKIQQIIEQALATANAVANGEVITPAITNRTAPALPSFQYGGIIPGLLGSPRLVLAHAGEEVKPYRTQQETHRWEERTLERLIGKLAADLKRGDTFTVNVATREPEPIAREVDKALRRYNIQAALNASRS